MSAALWRTLPPEGLRFLRIKGDGPTREVSGKTLNKRADFLALFKKAKEDRYWHRPTFALQRFRS